MDEILSSEKNIVTKLVSLSVLHKTMSNRIGGAYSFDDVYYSFDDVSLPGLFDLFPVWLNNDCYWRRI